MEQMESSDKCRHKTVPHRAKQKTSNLRATISTVLIVLGPEMLAVNVHHMIDMTHKTVMLLYIALLRILLHNKCINLENELKNEHCISLYLQ